MITASVNSQALNLPPDFTFELIRQSQLTSFDKLKGDLVPSISFPDTPRNRAVLQNPTLFELKRNGVKEFENFELMSEGFNIISGTLVLNNGLGGYVRGTVGNISAQNADKLITDYDLPVDQTFANKTSYDPATDMYDCPTIFNTDFFKDLSRTQEWPIDGGERTIENSLFQRYHRNVGYSVNLKSAGLTVIPTYLLEVWPEVVYPYMFTSCVTPFLFVFNALKMLLIKNKIYLISNELSSNDEINKILLYNNQSIVSFDVQLSEQQQTIYTPFGDVEMPVNIIKQYSQTLRNFNIKHLLPPVSIKSFILGLQNLLNICVVFNDNGTAVIIDREAVTEKTPVSLDAYFTGNWELGEKKNVELHFSMEHDNGDALFGTYYQDLTDREADFAADVSTMAELEALTDPPIGQLRRVTQVNRIYEYRLGNVIDPSTQQETEITAWFFTSIDFQTYKYNRETGVAKDVEEIKTSFSTLSDKNSSNTMQLGRCSIRRNEEATFTPRVFFNSGGSGKNNSTNYYLNWRGTNNLIETRWAKWAKFWANREAATGFFRLPAHMLQNFNMNVPYSTRQGTFLIDRMVTRITHNGIGETKAEVFKL
jgi:hypothetical protein